MTEELNLFAQSAALKAQYSALRTRIQNLSIESSSENKVSEKRFPDTHTSEGAASSSAPTLYLRLEKIIRGEQEHLADDEELQITYAGPGDEIITVFAIGSQGKDLILLYGEDEDGQTSTVMLQDNTVAIVMKNVKIPYQFERREVAFRGDIEQKSAESDLWRLGSPSARQP